MNPHLEPATTTGRRLKSKMHCHSPQRIAEKERNQLKFSYKSLHNNIRTLKSWKTTTHKTNKQENTTATAKQKEKKNTKKINDKEKYTYPLKLCPPPSLQTINSVNVLPKLQKNVSVIPKANK
jgi:hypothetical protein